MTMCLEDARVVSQEPVPGGYYRLRLYAPTVSPQVRPGQFVHVRLPAPADALLRRPFSVYRTDGPDLVILYKPVGRGTRAMTELCPGMRLNLLGPLGNGFPRPSVDHIPLLVAGGYGMAALYLLARESPVRGVVLVGGATSQDILCVPEFEQLGWEVRIATEDGSLGHRGIVTDLLDAWGTSPQSSKPPELFACGPNGMLQAVAERAIRNDWTAWLSMDRAMCCGVGACWTCVQKVRDPASPDGWAWVRICREGPVLEARQVVWE
jgi:dihydroorotate dehydrogenase electron transfer subunit